MTLSLMDRPRGTDPPDEPRRVSRRGVFAAMLALPVAAVAGLAARRVGDASPWLRPRPRGTSTDVCAACGATGHTMLAAGCPARPEIAS